MHCPMRASGYSKETTGCLTRFKTKYWKYSLMLFKEKFVSEAREHYFYGLTADGTTDVSTSEQFSLCLQYVDSKLEAVNVFLGFYSAPDSTGETLFSCIKDVFVRLNLPLEERLKGFCFDGAANMSGHISGVQAKLKEQCPNALYVHCSNHSLDLVLQEVAREVRLVADTLNFVRGVSVVIGESSKRKTLFQSMFSDDEVVCNLLSLCPTRWVVHTRAISRVFSSYTALLETLKMLEQDKTVRGDTQAKISGLYKQATKARTYFGLLSCEALFGPCEAVARILQSERASTRGALECVSAL